MTPGPVVSPVARGGWWCGGGGGFVEVEVFDGVGVELVGQVRGWDQDEVGVGVGEHERWRVRG